jgi:CyaY protein
MTQTLSDIDYLNHAEAALAAIERCCDQLNDTTDADIDNQRTGGMVTLTFSNKSQIIINLQKPLQEIWMAAKAGGFHYKFDGSAWRDTKQATELFTDLSRYASEQTSNSGTIQREALAFKAS